MKVKELFEDKEDYKKQVKQMNDSELEDECKSKIYLDALNKTFNPHTNLHVSICQQECERRGKKSIYDKALKRAQEGVEK